MLKDDKGVVKILFSISIGIFEANTAEMMAIKEAFKLFGASKWVESHSLIVESDSKMQLVGSTNPIKPYEDLGETSLSWKEFRRG